MIAAVGVDAGPETCAGRTGAVHGDWLLLAGVDPVQHPEVGIDLGEQRGFAPAARRAVRTLLIGPVVDKVAPFAVPLRLLAAIVAVLDVPAVEARNGLLDAVARGVCLVSGILFVNDAIQLNCG